MEKSQFRLKTELPRPRPLHTSNIGSLKMQNFNSVDQVFSEIGRVYAKRGGRMDDPAEANPTR